MALIFQTFGRVHHSPLQHHLSLSAKAEVPRWSTHYHRSTLKWDCRVPIEEACFRRPICTGVCITGATIHFTGVWHQTEASWNVFLNEDILFLHGSDYNFYTDNYSQLNCTNALFRSWIYNLGNYIWICCQITFGFQWLQNSVIHDLITHIRITKVG